MSKRAQISKREIHMAAQTLADPKSGKVAKSEAGEIMRLYQDQKQK